MINSPRPETQTAAETLDAPIESSKQILINWIIVALGLGGVAVFGAVLPELL